MMDKLFCQENEAQHLSYKLQQTAIASYQKLVMPLTHLSNVNREMAIMKKNSLGKYLKTNQQRMREFKKNEQLHNTISGFGQTRLELG